VRSVSTPTNRLVADQTNGRHCCTINGVTDVEVPIAQLRANLRRHLGAVADNGGRIVVTRYDAPIAALTPIDPEEDTDGK
jgi:hypothetical protein